MQKAPLHCNRCEHLFVIRLQVEEDTVLLVTDHGVKVASGIWAF